MCIHNEYSVIFNNTFFFLHLSIVYRFTMEERNELFGKSYTENYKQLMVELNGKCCFSEIINNVLHREYLRYNMEKAQLLIGKVKATDGYWESRILGHEMGKTLFQLYLMKDNEYETGDSLKKMKFLNELDYIWEKRDSFFSKGDIKNISNLSPDCNLKEKIISIFNENGSILNSGLRIWREIRQTVIRDILDSPEYKLFELDVIYSGESIRKILMFMKKNEKQK